MACSSPVRPWQPSDISTIEELRDAARDGLLPELCSCVEHIGLIAELGKKFGPREVEYAAKIACSCVLKCEPPPVRPPSVPPPPPPPPTLPPPPPPVRAACWNAPPPPAEYKGENNGY